MTELVARQLSVRVGGQALLSDASFSLQAGELVALLGPNGAGKTSLVRAALGQLATTSGNVTLGGDDIGRLSPMEHARRVSYLPQMRSLAWPISVRDVVALGRYSHGASLGRLGAGDAQAVDRALAACNLEDFAGRSCDTLSGGELARVHCARAFSAEAPLLVADEPMAALDPRHQFCIMDLVADFVRRGGGALVVVHDIGLAARYATRLMWMRDGRIVVDGTPAATLTASCIQQVYGVRARVNGLEVSIEGPV
jgi:iron complex transport system ATP-binding protein